MNIPGTILPRISVDHKAMDTLEALIDRWGLYEVTSAIGEIASGKADHLRSNWQDEASAKNWDKAAAVFMRADLALHRIQLPEPPTISDTPRQDAASDKHEYLSEKDFNAAEFGNSGLTNKTVEDIIDV